MMVSNSAHGAASASVTLAWDPSAGSVSGYHLYVGGTSQNYTNMVDTKSSTSGTVPGLAVGKTYYFAVTSYDSAGLESPFSPQVTYTIPVNTTNLAKITLKMGASKQMTLSGTAPAGYAYDVQATKDFKTWTTLTNVTASTSGTISYTEPYRTNQLWVYRLLQTAP
jgi:fibronectin type 3 domain-containing protein